MKWTYCAPSKLRKGMSLAMVRGFVLTYLGAGQYHLTHADFPTGVFIWRHVFWSRLTGRLRTKREYHIYQQLPKKEFTSFAEALEFAREQCLSIAAARRLGAELGKT